MNDICIFTNPTIIFSLKDYQVFYKNCNEISFQNVNIHLEFYLKMEEFKKIFYAETHVKLGNILQDVLNHTTIAKELSYSDFKNFFLDTKRFTFCDGDLIHYNGDNHILNSKQSQNNGKLTCTGEFATDWITLKEETFMSYEAKDFTLIKRCTPKKSTPEKRSLINKLFDLIGS
jgi:hypothetical protein